MVQTAMKDWDQRGARVNSYLNNFFELVEFVANIMWEPAASRWRLVGIGHRYMISDACRQTPYLTQALAALPHFNLQQFALAKDRRVQNLLVRIAAGRCTGKPKHCRACGVVTRAKPSWFTSKPVTMPHLFSSLASGRLGAMGTALLQPDLLS